MPRAVEATGVSDTPEASSSTAQVKKAAPKLTQGACIEQLEAQLQGLLDSHTQIRAQLQQACEQSNHLQQRLLQGGDRSRATTVDPETRQVIKSFSLKLPAFDGTTKNVEVFCTECEDHFETTNRPLDDHEKIIQIGFALRNAPRDWYRLYHSLPEAEHPAFLKSYSLFKKEFQTTWGDPDAQAVYEREFDNLRQVTSVTDYAKNFHRLIALLHYSKHANPLLVHHFYSGLHDNIKDKVTQEGKASTLDALVEQATRWDIRLQACKEEKSNEPSSAATAITKTTMFKCSTRPASATSTSVPVTDTKTTTVSSTCTTA